MLLLISYTGYTKQYKGAEIRTNESYLYGRFEVKMKSTQTSGMLISFFTFFDSPDFVHNWNEIDIEILGRYSNEVQYNAIVGSHKMHEKRQLLDYNPHKDFHIYSFDWTPDYIAWSVDGKELYRQTGEHVAAMNKPQKIMMNIWSSSFWEWTGPWDNPELPIFATYDYVKYYKYNSDKEDKFKLMWSDDFNSLDNSRWATATHTFEGNTCDFLPENVEVKDGFLYLKLSRDETIIEPINNEVKQPISSDKLISSATIESLSLIKVKFSKDIYKPASNKGYFKIEGVDILKSKLYYDLRTVDLSVSKLEEGKEYKLIYTSQYGVTQEIVIKGRP
jgi:beta-glucanase (GH16 family)